MLHPIILYELAKARYYELLQAAERYRQARKLSIGRAYGLSMVMSKSFAGQRPEEKTTLSILTR